MLRSMPLIAKTLTVSRKAVRSTISRKLASWRLKTPSTSKCGKPSFRQKRINIGADISMMQRTIYPPLAEHPKLRQSLTEGEKRVLDTFNDHLPSDWEIYIQPHLNGLRPDFVLLNPNGGIGVFEVKDWDLRAMRYFTRKNQWGHALWAERDGKEFCIQKENPITKVNLYKN